MRKSLHVLLFLCVLLGFPQGFLSSVIFSSQSFKRKEHGIEVPVLTLCFKLCLEFDNLSLFAQSMGCPRRLIETEPNQLSLKRLLHLKLLMHTHTHAYLLSYDRSRIILGNSQMSGQIQRQRQIEVNGNATTVCYAMSFPALRYLGTDASRGNVVFMIDGLSSHAQLRTSGKHSWEVA